MGMLYDEEKPRRPIDSHVIKKDIYFRMILLTGE
jgi:hypothetical protein